MTGPLRKCRRVVLVSSNALGDTLVLMVIVHNLLKSGAQVVVFGSHAYALRPWFPGVDIRPLRGDDARLRESLASCDLVLQMHGHQPVPNLTALHANVQVLAPMTLSRTGGSIARRFAEFCRAELGLADAGADNGITPPPGLRHRRHARRVAIHPEASTPDKRWLPRRFAELARRLQLQGYEVGFVVSPGERARWEWLTHRHFAVHTFDDTHSLAAWLYECGWFIGNDSGVGHLASNLGIPTLSLFRRRGVSERWRPAWGTNEVVLPWQWLPTSWLKERCWRETLTCARVLGAFERMAAADLQHYGATPSPARDGARTA
ncbi:glycosyl transferase [Burkholderia sp. WAC0059]|uniref:glycosyltransferase family 9 protein n=1 Tax=Burkholderia sp. WAC0059 TaxID=2066022 RepID=UPI000C7EC15A|nr:glycosyltransferase family 9 protein [Burkholderia sp. WAC0059]PLZ03087.1 glycosyl transferase [Burkholderia sp. WAC0059]